MIKMM